jgi:serine/threonine-protein kinase
MVIKGHLQHQPPALSAVRAGLPPALDAVLARGLAKRPEERFASCSELAAAARQTLTAPRMPPIPQVAHPYSPPQPPPPPAVPGPATPAPSPPMRPVTADPKPSAGGRPERSSIRKTIIIGVSLVLTVAAGVGIGVAASMFANSTSAGSTAAASSSATRTIDPQERKNIEEFEASIKSISAAFPNMVPASMDPNTKMTGYQDTEYLTGAGYRHINQGLEETDLENWVAKWECPGGTGDAAFRIYSYRSPDEAQSVIAALPPNATRSVDIKNGYTYTNYKFFTRDKMGYEAAYLMTTFPDDPNRANFLLIAIPRLMGRGQMDKLVNWWQSAPLS